MGLNEVSRDYTVMYFNVDQYHDLTISSLINYYTEIALWHTVSAGFTFAYFKERNLYWVLYKMQVQVYKYPKIYDNIRIRTWGYNLVKFNAYRKYEMLDEEGNVISEAEGIWMLLDSVKMRPTKMPDEMFDGYGVERGNKSRLEIDSLIRPENIFSKKEFSVNYSDIDINNHATNVKYPDWAMETVPHELRSTHMLTGLTVNYHKELMYNDPVVSICQQRQSNDELIFDHALIDPVEDKPTALLKSVWKKKPF